MSRATFDAPTTRPRSSWIGEIVSETSTRRPPFAIRSVSKCPMREPARIRARIASSSLARSGGMISRIDCPIASSAL
jgi:hypothetical protein